MTPERMAAAATRPGRLRDDLSLHEGVASPSPTTDWLEVRRRSGNDDDVLVGVASVGRCVAAAFNDGLTLEVNRTCTDGTKNANSMLYGAAARAGFAMGYRRLVTYTQDGESGASLRLAGWKVVAERHLVKAGTHLPDVGRVEEWTTCREHFGRHRDPRAHGRDPCGV